MGKVTTRQMQCSRMFCALGYMPSGASAIVGNLSWESGGANLPTAFRRTHLDHGSNGMPQWRLSRLDGYEAFVQAKQPDATNEELWGHYGRMDYQVQYIDHELRQDYPALYRKLTLGGPVAALTADFTWTYERPSRKYAHLNERISFAQAIYAALDPAKDSPVSITNALDMDAAKHTQAAAGGVVVATVGAVTGAGSLLPAVLPHMHTVEIVGLAAGALLIVGGVVGWAIYMAQAARVRSAKIGLDPTLPPKVLIDPPKEPPPPEPGVRPITTLPKVRKPTAAEEEAASIKAMLEHALPPASKPADPVPPAVDTSDPASPLYHAPATHTLT